MRSVLPLKFFLESSKHLQSNLNMHLCRAIIKSFHIVESHSLLVIKEAPVVKSAAANAILLAAKTVNEAPVLL